MVSDPPAASRSGGKQRACARCSKVGMIGMGILGEREECLACGARLLAPAEVRPDEVAVNGRGLSQGELNLLLGCAVPREQLAPRHYRYDKDSGLWGKEGDRPDRIVSSKLSVGRKLQADASNGIMQVFINGREITKTELRMLKMHSSEEEKHFKRRPSSSRREREHEEPRHSRRSRERGDGHHHNGSGHKRR